MQGWIERTGLHLEHFAGPVADHLCNGVTVHWLAQKRLEDEHVQRSLQQFDTILVFRSVRHLDVDTLLPWLKNVYLRTYSSIYAAIPVVHCQALRPRRYDLFH